jgi:hypothetical protein
MSIDVYIDRLIVDEPLSRGGAHDLRLGLQRELTRLLRDGGLSQELHSSVALSSMRGGAIAGRTDRTAAPIGPQVARAVYAAIGSKVDE